MKQIGTPIESLVQGLSTIGAFLALDATLAYHAYHGDNYAKASLVASLAIPAWLSIILWLVYWVIVLN